MVYCSLMDGHFSPLFCVPLPFSHRKVNKCYRGRSCPIIVHCRYSVSKQMLTYPTSAKTIFLFCQKSSVAMSNLSALHPLPASKRTTLRSHLTRYILGGIIAMASSFGYIYIKKSVHSTVKHVKMAGFCAVKKN